jgi:hypothetical protein
MTLYSNNGVTFSVPETWEVVEDDSDEVIRAITLECPNDGIYMIDIYNKDQAPLIDKYINNQWGFFIKKLPFGNRLIEGTFKSPDKSRHMGKEILVLKSPSRFEHCYLIVENISTVSIESKPTQKSVCFLAIMLLKIILNPEKALSKLWKIIMQTKTSSNNRGRTRGYAARRIAEC